MLLLGVIMLPTQVALQPEELPPWEGAATLLFSVVGGAIGLVSLASVISRLLGSGERFERPVPVLGGVLAGIAALLLPILPAIGEEGEFD